MTVRCSPWCRSFASTVADPPKATLSVRFIAEIDALIQKIYEDNASGKLSDERYATLSLSYEEEQKTLKTAVPEMQAYLETETDKTESLHRFIQKVKQITELKALTPEEMEEAFQHHLTERNKEKTA